MFALRLKELREEKGLSQYGLATRLQCPQSTIGGWEAGRRETSFAMLNKLASFFGVSTDYLLGHDETITEEERAAGVADTVKVRLTADEDDLLVLYRALREKRGAAACQAVKNVMENML